MPLAPDDLDGLDEAILDYFQVGRDKLDQPWGKATPTEVYTHLDETGALAEFGSPVRQTIQSRIQRLELAGHLDNINDVGVYQFVSDPRNNSSD